MEEKIMALEELIIFIKGLNDYNEYYFNISTEEDGYCYTFQKIPTYGYILGVPGLDKMDAVTFNNFGSVELEDFDDYFKKASEMLDESYDSDKLYVTFYNIL